MITFKKIDPNAVIPVRATDGSAGFDLVANEEVHIERFRWAAIGTGIAVSVGVGNVGLVCPRSGLALKEGITVPNAPGVIDADYTGEVKVILYNLGLGGFFVSRGMRIAQLVVVPYLGHSSEVSRLEDTARGAGGFGSTGLSS